jgi:hypothetical protein
MVPVRPKPDAIYPTFASYRKRTSRVIPIIELTPTSMMGASDTEKPASDA